MLNIQYVTKKKLVLKTSNRKKGFPLCNPFHSFVLLTKMMCRLRKHALTYLRIHILVIDLLFLYTYDDNGCQYKTKINEIKD